MHWSGLSTTEKPSETSAGTLRGTRSWEVLVMDRDPELRVFLNKALFAGNVSSTSVSSGTEAFACLRKDAYDGLIVGLDSPESMDFLHKARAEFPTLPLVAVARAATPELVREVLQAGVTDFLFGSLDVRAFAARIGAILGGVKRAVEEPVPKVEKPAAEAVPLPAGTLEIVCRNKRMQRILEIAETIAPTDSTVLIQGESGTGKELIAKRIHVQSKRKDKPFVEVNCGALPESLLESQLFGHEKGSFTGAVHRQVGLFEIADQGTIFLDEVGEMSMDMQVKLLRVLQFREFRRIGGSQVVHVDVRVIAATNKDLKAEVEKKNFRVDLFYRLNVIALEIPPLRERLEEIPDLVAGFARRYSEERGLPLRRFAPDAVLELQKYRWTGNVRELENAVERIILLSKKDEIETSDLREHLGGAADLSEESPFAPTLTLDEVKRIHIGNVLKSLDGNKMRTARVLKINVKTLYNLMKRLDIEE